jgi:hypothetical protein
LADRWIVDQWLHDRQRAINVRRSGEAGAGHVDECEGACRAWEKDLNEAAALSWQAQKAAAPTHAFLCDLRL